VQIETRVRNDGTRADPVHAGHQHTRPGGQSGAVRGGGPGGCGRGRLRVRYSRVTVAKPNLWSVANPYLYKVRSTVRVEDRVVDQYDTPSASAKAIFDADKGFLLNGEHVKLNGVCIHHDAGCVGAACPSGCGTAPPATARDGVQRHPHQPQSLRGGVLDLCDRLGFLVMNEPSTNGKVPKRTDRSLRVQQLLRRMVRART